MVMLNQIADHGLSAAGYTLEPSPGNEWIERLREVVAQKLMGRHAPVAAAIFESGNQLAQAR